MSPTSWIASAAVLLLAPPAHSAQGPQSKSYAIELESFEFGDGTPEDAVFGAKAFLYADGLKLQEVRVPKLKHGVQPPVKLLFHVPAAEVAGKNVEVHVAGHFEVGASKRQVSAREKLPMEGPSAGVDLDVGGEGVAESVLLRLNVRSPVPHRPNGNSDWLTYLTIIIAVAAAGTGVKAWVDLLKKRRQST